jgi:hypothetical protein
MPTPNAVPEFPVTPPDIPPAQTEDTVEFPDAADGSDELLDIPDPVTVVPYLPSLDLSALTDESSGDTPGYLGAGVETEYFVDTGLRCLPVAGAKRSAPADYTRRHTGWGWKIITAVLTRMNEKPDVPDPDTLSPNDVLITKQVKTFSPGLTPSGNVVYGVVIRYTYSLQMPPDDDVDSYDFGTTPLGALPASTYTLDPADFTSYLTASDVTGAPTTPISF